MNINKSLKISTKKLKQKNIPSATLDAEVLLLEALNKSNKNIDKSWLYVNNNYELSKKEETLFKNFIDQRKKHKPVAYIVNKKEFFGYDFYIDENVLIPRPETELMVEEVLKIINPPTPLIRQSLRAGSYQGGNRNFNLIDIGTGSGCILISILNELRKNKKGDLVKQSIAIDISKKAIEIAMINAKKYNLENNIKFINVDFREELNQRLFSNSNQFIITANLPYIRNNEYKYLSPDVKKYEPKLALTGGKNGLDLIEKLIKIISETEVKSELPNYIFLEADPRQMNKITAVIREELDSTNIKIIKDLSGKERIAILSYC
ncbi:MAG: peptide chain release factor N(5)-glutamine methyltransferase [Candidatus Pacebacteria bacterium]|nr:peptide chain release factor N(5)-glutamine methyltransferase [Candidatus Paceibacterota bacterium]